MQVASSQQIYENLIKAINDVDDAIYFKDLDGRYTYVNITAARLIGLPEHKIIGKKDADIFPSSALKKIIELDSRVLNQKQSISTETQYKIKGRELYFQTVISPAYSSNTEIIGLVGISRDISIQKQATRDLKNYSEELDIILSNSSDAIYRKDLHGRYVFINTAGSEMMSLLPEDIIGHTDTELFGEHVSKRIRKTDRNVINTQVKQAITTKYSGVKGDHWFNVSISPAYDSDNRVIGVVGVSQSITHTKKLELELREKNEQLITILESSKDAIFAKDIDGIYLFVNRACEEFIGKTSSEIVGHKDEDIFPPEVFETIRTLDLKVMDSKQHISNDECFGKKGDQSWYQATISPAYSAHGEIVGVIGISRNMTEYQLAQEELWKSQAKYHSLYHDTPAIFITLDVEGAVVEANAFGAKKLGYTIDELKNSSIYNIIPVEDRNKFRNNIQTALDNPGTLYQTERRYIAKDGTIIWGKDFLRVVFDQDGNPSIPILSEDVTTAKELSDELYFRENHDLVTGLYNRAGFESQIERSIQSANNKNISHILFMVELDNIKLINDIHGQKASDELLHNIGELISSTCRKRDMLARISSNQFSVLVENTTLPEIDANLEILLEKILDYKFNIGEQLFHLSANIGVFEIDSQTTDIEYALARVKNSVISAKELGKNRIHFYDKSDVGIKSRQTELAALSDINLALANDRFVLHAQQITSIQHPDLPSFEILTRMLNESGEYASPAQFIPILEQYHLAHELDDWVIRNTFKWLSENREVLTKVNHFSINLSGQSLSNEDLLDKICNYFIDYAVPYETICFEITETAAISALQQALSFINTLRNYGCLISLDDFGAGLSSFQYLRDLPVDYVKIDGAFIKNICLSDSDFMITRGMNDLVHQMGMLTVAEYVENEEIYLLLKSIGIDFAQGYHFGRLSH